MGKLDLLNSALHKIGFELMRYDVSQNNILRRNAVLQRYNVDLVIDVGANTGIFANEIRQTGFKGNIVSFEPLPDAYKGLIKRASKDPKWKTYNIALGSETGTESINVSANSHSSSLLDILDTHTQAEASASYVGKHEIQIKTLDSIFDEIKGGAREIYLKIDTQGFEMNVLKGAINSLKEIQTIQLELSLRPLYAGQVLYNELMEFLYPLGYRLIDVEPGFTDFRTGALLQFDGVFNRSEDSNRH